MGYELRSVPRDWVHPQGKALYAGHEYHEHCKAREAAEEPSSPREQGGNPYPSPDPADYMPDWLPEQAPCLQWYETVSEGTPISPIFESEAEAEAWMGEYQNPEPTGPGGKSPYLGENANSVEPFDHETNETIKTGIRKMKAGEDTTEEVNKLMGFLAKHLL